MLGVRAGKFSLVWCGGGGEGWWSAHQVLLSFVLIKYHHRSDEEKFRERTSSICTVLSILKKLVAVIPPKL